MLQFNSKTLRLKGSRENYVKIRVALDKERMHEEDFAGE